MNTTPTTQTPTHERFAYRPRRAHALRLEAGCSLWLSHTRLPETRMLIQNEHFTWEPPHKGRVIRRNEFSGHGDPSAAARFTALVPLLISLHEPWANFSGGVTIGHLRLARETSDNFDLVCNMPEASFLKDPGREIKMALRENNRPDHLVAGGPAFAVAYHDEKVIPAFWYKEGTETMPFTHIIHADEVSALQLAWRQQGRVIRAAAENPYAAEEGKLGAVPAGKLIYTVLRNVMVRGEKKDVQIGYDTSGVVFALSVGGRTCGSCLLKPGLTVALRGMITDRWLRSMLHLPSLETGMVEPALNATKAPSLNNMADAFSDAEKIAALTPKRETPKAVRRAEAPKPSDVTAEAELVEAQVAEVETFFEALPQPEQEVVEAAQPSEEQLEVVSVENTDIYSLTELEIACLESLYLLLEKSFVHPVYTGDNRLIIASEKMVDMQDLVNLVAHKGDWVGDEEELMLARIAIMEAEENFKPATEDCKVALEMALAAKGE